MEELVLRMAVAAGLLSLVAGPLGCFVVWQRMAYFGDTLAHSALLGIGFSLILHLPYQVGTLLAAALIAVLLAAFTKQSKHSEDTVLGLLAHVSLAGGVVLLGVLGQQHIDWMSYLFGDLLSVSWQDIGAMLAIEIVILCLLAKFWNALIRVAIDSELAQVDGLAVERLRLLLLLLIAATVASAIQVVGVLLVTALLIIPAAAARNLSSTPQQMAMWSIAVGALGSLGGISLSYAADISVGPAIVLSAFAIFLFSEFNRRTG